MWYLLCACLTPTSAPTEAPTPEPTEVPEPTGAPDPTGRPEPTGTPTVEPEEPHRWVAFAGGTFVMGTDAADAEDTQEVPAHSVTVPPFELMRHEVTLADYAACEAAGLCTPRSTEGNCLTGDSATLPANCLDWFMAGEVCAFLDGRLPTESEWEFAARDGGLDLLYPWGDAPPDCTRANVNQPGLSSCDGAGLWEVCTHPAGNTGAGLCEMGGNVFEWVEDWHNEYVVHPTDGSAQTEQLFYFRGMRGGSIGSDQSVRTRQRTFHAPEFRFSGMGARCARSP